MQHSPAVRQSVQPTPSVRPSARPRPPATQAKHKDLHIQNQTLQAELDKKLKDTKSKKVKQLEQVVSQFQAEEDEVVAQVETAKSKLLRTDANLVKSKKKSSQLNIELGELKILLEGMKDINIAGPSKGGALRTAGQQGVKAQQYLSPQQRAQQEAAANADARAKAQADARQAKVDANELAKFLDQAGLVKYTDAIIQDGIASLKMLKGLSKNALIETCRNARMNSGDAQKLLKAVLG